MVTIAQPIAVPTTAADFEAAREFYTKNGFLYMNNFFSAEEVASIRKWTDELGDKSASILAKSIAEDIPLEKLIADDASVPVIVPEKASKSQVCRIEDYINPTLSGGYLHHSDKVRDFLTALFAEPYALFKEKINFKWPGGGAFPPHQDYPAYGFLAPTSHATAMIAIDPATAENGCLQVALGWTESLKGSSGVDAGRLEQGTAVVPFYEGGPDNGTIKTEYTDKMTWAEVRSEPHQLLIFSSFIPHYSLVNGADKSRRAMFLTHNRLAEGEQRTHYYDKKRNDPNNPMFHIATPTQHAASNM